MKIHVVSHGCQYEGQTPIDIGLNRAALIKEHVTGRFILRGDLSDPNHRCYDYDAEQLRIRIDSFDIDTKQVLRAIARTKRGRDAIYAMVCD